MRKISGDVVSRKPIKLSRAAKLISRFAALDNGSSAAISMYLQSTADAFNHLVQFRDKCSMIRNSGSISDWKSIRKLQMDVREKGENSEIRVKKSNKRTKKSAEGDLQEKCSGKKKSRDEAVDS